MAQVAHVARASLFPQPQVVQNLTQVCYDSMCTAYTITADMNTFAPWPAFTSTSPFANKLVTTAIFISALR